MACDATARPAPPAPLISCCELLDARIGQTRFPGGQPIGELGRLPQSLLELVRRRQANERTGHPREDVRSLGSPVDADRLDLRLRARPRPLGADTCTVLFWVLAFFTQPGS